MKVCVAEKPSVAREIAQVIGADQKKDGYYEGNGYQVSWTFGHFCTLYTPDDYKPYWKRWDLNTLPMLPDRFETKLIDNDGVKKQFGVLKNLFASASEVINCGDAGQEGELIQRWVLKQAKFQGPVQRLWISSLTSEAIKAGFEDLKDAKQYDALYYAGSSRAIGDWLLGMNATRLYTLKYGGKGQVLSIGRVQTPTLAMLVERHLEIENFKPQPYWELQTLYRDTLFNNEEGKFFKKEDGEKLLNQVKDQPLTITEVQKKKGKETPPRLFDLTSLQVYSNNKFGFTAEQTLKIAQSLYEQKLITYPRVDTTFLPNDQYPKIEGILKNLTNYSQLISPLLGKKIRKSTKVFNDKKVTDHHAIIPTGQQSGLSDANQKVYDAITRHFIAAFYPDCQVANTSVKAEVNEVLFKATGKEILEEGWRAVFANPDKVKSNEEGVMPTFVKGETGPHEPSFTEKQTKAPRAYTEATLLRAMETAGKHVEDEELRDLMKANGIGRPSTRANIIETLFKRKYIERNKKQIVPTPTGVQLIGLIDNELLKSAELTGRWEKQLKDIETGEYSAARFINAMKLMVDNLVAEVRLSKAKVVLSAQTEKTTKTQAKPKTNKSIIGQTCPKCQKGKLLKGKTGFGCSRWNENCKFLLPNSFEGKKISDNQLKRIIDKGSTTLLKGFKINGEKVNGKIVLSDDFQLKLEIEKSEKNDGILNCPRCKKGEVIKGQTAFGCNRWKEGCDFKMSFDEVRLKAEGKELSKELIHKIISAAS
ncbi:MAG: DNA topoisomerase 3 [Schleiferiaceae bacterium]|nr:DNA topoisomerase 3 [Schleiferiaceae bacterium]